MMHSAIIDRLEAFSKAKNVRILFAIESGSRAWGFASPDSDYDVRAVFVRPKHEYLSVSQPTEDLSQLDGDFDLGAWDIRKFLRLARKSNATPLEWLQSPIQYVGSPETVKEVYDLCTIYFQPRTTLNHYRGLARKSWLSFDENGFGRLKKFFYVLRPLLAARWIADRGTVPPMEFEPLLAMIDSNAVLNEIEQLVKLKVQVGEEHEDMLPKLLQDYASETFDYLGSLDILKVNTPAIQSLDLYFRKVIGNSKS